VKPGSLFLLLGVLALACPAAAGIVLSSPAREVTVPAAEGGTLPVIVENTYPEEVTGTLVRISTVADDGNSEPVTTIQSARLVVPQGARQTRITLPPAAPGRIERIDLRFEYALAGVDRVAALPEILVRFEEQPAGGQANDPVRSTDAPGPHAVQTAAAGRDPLTVDEALQRVQALAVPAGTSSVVSTPTPTPSLDTFERFLGSSLVLSANRTLLDAGFVSKTSSMVANSPSTVLFSEGFSRNDGRVASLEAAIDRDGPRYVLTRVDDYLELQHLDENATVQSLLAEAAAAGLPCVMTVANATPDNATAVSITFQDHELNRASLDAIVRNGTIVSLVIEHPPSPFAALPSTVIGFVVPVAISLLVCALLIGAAARLSRRPATAAPPTGVAARDRRAEAAALIAAADSLHAAGDVREACRHLGQAFRLHLSAEHHLEIEATDREILTHLGELGEDTDQVSLVLDRCARIAYGGAAVEADDYPPLRLAVTSGTGPGDEE